MDVILLERVEKLGRIGDIVAVKPGFARNYLLPGGKALRATEANKARFEAERAQIEAESERRRSEAADAAKGMTDLSVVLIRQAASSGALYGSVSARDIVAALADAGHKVPRSAVVLEQPIKMLGVSEVKLKLHPEVSVLARVNVARSPEEAELQAKGIDVTAERFERDEAGFTDEEAAEAAETSEAADAAADSEAAEASEADNSEA